MTRKLSKNNCARSIETIARNSEISYQLTASYFDDFE